MINKRQIQEVNAGSMADIAFLLLIFFLVATTMDVDKGIQRVLPPMPPEDQKVDDIKIKERNLLLVFVNQNDNIMVGGEIIDIRQLKDKAKDFVMNVRELETLPERKTQKIDLLGDVEVSEGIISLQNDRGTSYEMYIKVQNELTRAFGEIRDEFSTERFGRKFMELSEDQRKAVQQAVPQKISEAEPRNIGGK